VWLLLSALLIQTTLAKDADGCLLRRCPVDGQLANSSGVVQQFLHGQLIALQCDECKRQFQLDPMAYVVAKPSPLEPCHLGTVVKCPLSGEEITVTHDTARVEFLHGQSVFFCCPKCATKFLANIPAFFA